MTQPNPSISIDRITEAAAKAGLLASKIRIAIGQAVVGQAEVIDQVLVALFAAGQC